MSALLADENDFVGWDLTDDVVIESKHQYNGHESDGQEHKGDAGWVFLLTFELLKAFLQR